MANHKLLIANTKFEEGGLSKAKTDSASKNPVPDGSGYHTNKGITWSTFVNLAKRCGYVATPSLFYAMPNDIWEKIFKIGYWDAVNGDNIKSQAIANVLCDFAWGAGPGTAVKKMQLILGIKVDGVAGAVTVQKINAAKEKELFEKITAAKKNFYLTLPGQSANYNGWAARLQREYDANSKLITIVAVSAGGILAGLIGLSALVYYNS